jgi:hypothetical protein
LIFDSFSDKDLALVAGGNAERLLGLPKAMV